MFFFFSKLTYILICPENWIIALLLIIFFTKSPIVKKRLTVSVIVLILLFGNEVIYTKLALAWQAEPVTIPEGTSYNAGILLGGLSSFDKHRKGFLNGASDRFVETCILYHTGKIKKVVISGGALYKDEPREGDFLYKKLLEEGIPPGDIILENKSRTTFENAVFTHKILDSVKLPPPYVLITSALHIPRAKRVFEKAGLNVVPYPSHYIVLDKKFNVFDYIIPKMSTIDGWSGLMKEFVGIIGYTIFNKA